VSGLPISVNELPWSTVSAAAAARTFSFSPLKNPLTYFVQYFFFFYEIFYGVYIRRVNMTIFMTEKNN
jgi:hypothetical protein